MKFAHNNPWVVQIHTICITYMYMLYIQCTCMTFMQIKTRRPHPLFVNVSSTVLLTAKQSEWLYEDGTDLNQCHDETDFCYTCPSMSLLDQILDWMIERVCCKPDDKAGDMGRERGR